MKKIVLTFICAIAAHAVFGQGGMEFINSFSATSDRHPVYAPQLENPFSMVVGQSSLGAPTGTTVYDGGLLGPGYDFALFAGPVGTPSAQLTLATTVAFRSSATGGLPQGLILGTFVTISSVPGGQSCDYQLRAWFTEGGTVNDWSTALLNYDLGDSSMQIGWTPVLTTTSVLASGVLTPPNTDFTSFSLMEAPEPAVISVCGLGAAMLLGFRARSRAQRK